MNKSLIYLVVDATTGKVLESRIRQTGDFALSNVAKKASGNRLYKSMIAHYHETLHRKTAKLVLERGTTKVKAK